MRRIATALSCFSLSWALIGEPRLIAQDFVPWANKFFNQEDTPSLIVHDFGTVPQTTVLKHRFKITNIYKVPIQIVERPIVSCGCVEPVSWPTSLQPKEEGFLDLTMDAKRFQGAKSVTIQVKFVSGVQYYSTAMLQVRAHSRSDLSLLPGSLDFGQIAVGQNMTRTLDVIHNGRSDWAVQSFEANPNLFDVKVEAIPNATNSRKMNYRVTASVKADVPPGVLQETIVLRTNDPSSPFLQIPINGTVLAPYVVTPARLQFIDMDESDTANRRLIISAKKKFRIAQIDGQGDGLTAQVNAEANVANQTQFLEVKYSPTKGGDFTRELKLKTDTGETIVVPVEVQVKTKK